ncbi:MAG: hypothetical protein ACRC8A_12650 [Microcoleaceae cyanobacterium]
MTAEETLIKRYFERFKKQEKILAVLGKEGFEEKLEEWFERWETGFRSMINRPPHSSTASKLTTNYPIATTTTAKGWRIEKERRPAYLIWKNPNPKAFPGYKTIEYFPDRSNTTKSYVLTGNDTQIIKQILQIEYEGGGSNQERQERFTQSPSFRGFPKVQIWFLEVPKDVPASYQPATGQIGFRLLNKTERWDLVNSGQLNYEKLRNSEIQKIAERIIEQFSPGGVPYRWVKGKNCFSYRDKHKGIETRGYVRTKADGIELSNKLCAVAQVVPSTKAFRYTEPQAPETDFPEVVPNRIVLGDIKPGIRSRPNTNVYFDGATLAIEGLAQDIRLCNSTQVLFIANAEDDQDSQGGGGSNN